MYQKIRKKIKEISIFDLGMLVSVTVILFAFGTSIYMNICNRSLWFDEAMLAESLGRRNFFNLTSDLLDWMQSAPVLYLYIVKLLTVLFGYTERILRLFSLISYFLSIILVYFSLKNFLSCKYPMFGTAFVANIPILLFYSNEFKPYISDCLSVLLILYIFYMFDSGKIKWIYFIISSCILIWLSNPVCFFVGGILVYESIYALIKKNKKRFLAVILGGVGVLISFGIYYFYWLKPVLDAGGMSDYWAGNKFPLFPNSHEDLLAILESIRSIISELGQFQVVIAILVFACIIINIFIGRNKYIIIIAIGIYITLFASMLGMFPIATRLFLFIYPIIGILAFSLLDKCFTKNNLCNIVLIILLLVIIYSPQGIQRYMNEKAVFMEREETNPLIEYVQHNISAEEQLYVYYHSIPVFEFKNGYDNDSIGKYNKNVIYGKGFFQNGENQDDISYIITRGNMYVLLSHTYDFERIEELINALNNSGYFEKVKEVYSTPLFYYTNDLENTKINCELKINKYIENDEGKKAIIEIKNVGNAYLNNGYEELYLCARNKEDSINEILSDIKIDADIAPGGILEVELNLNEIEDLDKIEIQLVKEGKYWFDDLGVTPAIIKIEQKE